MIFKLADSKKEDKVIEWKITNEMDYIRLQARKAGSCDFWYTVFEVRESDGRGRCVGGIGADLGLPLNKDGSIQFYS